MRDVMRRELSMAALLLAAATAAPAAHAHDGEDHGATVRTAVPQPAAAAPESAPRRLADGSLFVPKAAQHRLGIRHRAARIESLAASLEFNGRVIADPNASGRVQAAQAGRIEAGARGLPRLGQKVARGEVLAWLQPVAASIEAGNQRAQLAELEAALAIAQRKRERYDQLEGAVAQSAIEAARLEAAALQRRRDAVAASLGAAEPLRAPVDGVIGSLNVVAGQIVDAREILFEVVDPARLVVEALAYDLAGSADLGRASASLGGERIELEFLGAARQLREEALPLLFRVVSGGAALAVGQPLKVLAQARRTVQGAAVPHAALVKVNDGSTAVWLHESAERFILRAVETAPLDAGRVAVVRGLEAGDRVVTDGASLLSQVR